MQRAARGAVHIDRVVDDANAEAIDVEVGVAGLQRIERPELTRDAASCELGALGFLEPASDAHLARFGANAEHVRPVNDFVVSHSGEAEDESDQHIVSEGAENEAPDVRGDLQDGGGNDIGELGAPDGDLEIDARLELVERLEVPDAGRLGIGFRRYASGGWRRGNVASMRKHAAGERVYSDAANIKFVAAYRNGIPKGPVASPIARLYTCPSCPHRIPPKERRPSRWRPTDARTISLSSTTSFAA